jgi:hypothetical protein
MVESYAASEELGFVALTLREGGFIWLAAASIYAVEKNPTEDFSMVKTVGEPLGVLETPQQVFEAIEALQAANAKRGEERQVRKFVDWVHENSIQVTVVPDEEVTLVESDPRAKLLKFEQTVNGGDQVKDGERPNDIMGMLARGAHVHVLPGDFGARADDVEQAEAGAFEIDLSKHNGADDNPDHTAARELLRWFEAQPEGSYKLSEVLKGVDATGDERLPIYRRGMKILLEDGSIGQIGGAQDRSYRLLPKDS